MAYRRRRSFRRRRYRTSYQRGRGVRRRLAKRIRRYAPSRGGIRL